MGKAQVHGNISIEMDRTGPPLTLTARFTADPQGKHLWDTATMQDLLERSGAPSVVTPDVIDRFLKRAATVDEHEAVLAKGVEPTEPEAESVQWSGDLSTPEALAEAKGSVVDAAQGPEIYHERKRTIQREQAMEKKARLPFMQAKIEKKKIRETVIDRERVYVDPTVETSYFVEQNTVLGIVTPMTTGEPGVDIFGRNIPARRLADPNFHAGDGIERNSNQLTAKQNGFLRIGRNWADIVPFRLHEWQLRSNADNIVDCLFFVVGNPEAPLPDVARIRATAAEQNVSSHGLLDNETIQAALAKAVAAGGKHVIPLFGTQDAGHRITVSDDGLKATLDVHKSRGNGQALKLKDVGATITSAGLKGLNVQKIKHDITEFYNSSELDLVDYVLATGTPSVPGVKRKVEFAVRFDSRETTDKLKAQLMQTTESGRSTVDSIEQFPPDRIEKTALVQAEQLICTIDPPSGGEPGKNVFGEPIPPEPGAHPSLELAGALEVHKDDVVSTAAGILDYAEIENGYALRVRGHINARVAVSVDEDRMQAYITLHEGAGSGHHLNDTMIRQAIEAAGVVRGIDETVLAAAIADAQRGEEVVDVAFAFGTEPTHQNDTRVEYVAQVDPSTRVRIRKDGSADYKSHSDIVTVQKDQHLARIIVDQRPPADGMDITGKSLPAEEKQGLDIEIGANIEEVIAESGDRVLRATADGILSKRRGVLSIETSHVIKGDVDMNVGNLKLPGSISIAGSVRSGFYVVSGENITVDATVEGALLSAEGNITIGNGIKGCGKAIVRSKGQVATSFAELSTVLCVGDLILKTAIVRCRVKCNGSIRFQGKNGRILGGRIRARYGMTVHSIGSATGSQTTISFGQDYLIMDLIEKEETEIEKLKQSVLAMDTKMRRYPSRSDDPSLAKLRTNKVKLLKLLEKRGLRLFTLRERFEQHFPSQVTVTGTVFPGTIFESHGRTLEITDVKKRYQVTFNPHTGNLEHGNPGDA